VIAGCAANLTATTRPTLGEMTGMTEAIVQSIASSPALTRRGATSTPMVLTVGSIENRSSDVFTRSEQWYLMQSVAREIANPAGMGDERSIAFVMPPEAVRDIRRRGGVWSGFAEGREPTHALNGRFATITRAGAEDREDFFEFAYQIVELSSGQIVVEEAVDVQKSASGRLFN
jgi:hypothetical protein